MRECMRPSVKLDLWDHVVFEKMIVQAGCQVSVCENSVSGDQL